MYEESLMAIKLTVQTCVFLLGKNLMKRAIVVTMSLTPTQG